jgi:hypothetical protein
MFLQSANWRIKSDIKTPVRIGYVPDIVLLEYSDADPGSGEHS